MGWRRGAGLRGYGYGRPSLQMNPPQPALRSLHPVRARRARSSLVSAPTAPPPLKVTGDTVSASSIHRTYPTPPNPTQPPLMTHAIAVECDTPPQSLTHRGSGRYCQECGAALEAAWLRQCRWQQVRPRGLTAVPSLVRPGTGRAVAGTGWRQLVPRGRG